MSAIHPIVCIVGSLVLLAAVGGAAAGGTTGDARLRADVAAVSRRTVFFGHQSVGLNLIDGLRELAGDAGVEVLIVETQSALGLARGTFGHVSVGRNGDPESKLRSFERALGPGPAGPEIALMKFCYVDFEPGTDAAALFRRYQQTIGELRARHPATTFVHVTAPLTTVQGGPKALVKHLLGRQPYGLVENARREEYNSLLRQDYAGREPLFDLAKVEASAADGTPVTVEWNGRQVPSMAPGYTDDGGHLNRAGRLRAARELASVLGAIP